MLDTSGWSATKKIKYGLLKRAFNENRGAEMILLIQWRLAYERHMNEGGVKALRAFEQKNANQPRAIRALNLIAKEKGIDETYFDVSTKKGAKADFQSIMEIIEDTPAEKQIIFTRKQNFENTIGMFPISLRANGIVPVADGSVLRLKNGSQVLIVPPRLSAAVPCLQN
jgi:hypothetical protein